MEENEELDSDFNTDNIPISDGFWNYMENYWHHNREFPESTEVSLNKKADLIDGKVPSSQLPSYVDDVVEFESFENLPNPGEKGKIYVLTNDNSQYRWSGSEYIQLNSGENVMTTNTQQGVSETKRFLTKGGNGYLNNSLFAYTNDGSYPAMTFHRDGDIPSQILFQNDTFYFLNGVNSDRFKIESSGFIKAGYNNGFILLAGGGHAPISEFVTNSDLSNQLTNYHKIDFGNSIDNGSISRVNKSWFDYNWAETGKRGSLINFSGLNGNYSTELFGSYDSPNNIAIRTRNGDTNSWNEPRWLWHNKNFNPDSKLNAVDNAVALGYGGGGSSSAVPYVRHSNGTYTDLATLDWVNLQNFATVGNVNNKIDKSGDIITGALISSPTSIYNGNFLTFNSGYFSNYSLKIDGVGTDAGISMVKDDGTIFYKLSTNGNILINNHSDDGTNSKLQVNGNVSSLGYKKFGSNDDWVLLGGGNHKAISDFATSANVDSKVNKSGDTMTGNLTVPNITLSSSTFASNTLNGSQVLATVNDTMYIGNTAGLDFLNFQSTYGLTHYQNGIPGQIWTEHNFNPNNYIPTSHHVYSISSNDIKNWKNFVGYWDNRSIKPNHISPEKLQIGFTSLNNDTSYPYADYLHFGGYADSSGGLQNLIMFGKNSFGIRQYLGDYQSTIPYKNYVDYWHTNNLSQAHVEYLGYLASNGAATMSWIQSQNYITPDFVEEKLNELSGEITNPDYPIYIRNKFSTIIITEDYREPLQLEGELIPESYISIINLSKSIVDLNRFEPTIDRISEQETTEYYINKEQRLIKKGSYRSAQILT